MSYIKIDRKQVTNADAQRALDLVKQSGQFNEIFKDGNVDEAELGKILDISVSKDGKIDSADFAAIEKLGLTKEQFLALVREFGTRFSKSQGRIGNGLWNNAQSILQKGTEKFGEAKWTDKIEEKSTSHDFATVGDTDYSGNKDKRILKDKKPELKAFSKPIIPSKGAEYVGIHIKTVDVHYIESEIHIVPANYKGNFPPKDVDKKRWGLENNRSDYEKLFKSYKPKKSAKRGSSKKFIKMPPTISYKVGLLAGIDGDADNFGAKITTVNTKSIMNPKEETDYLRNQIVRAIFNKVGSIHDDVNAVFFVDDSISMEGMEKALNKIIPEVIFILRELGMDGKFRLATGRFQEGAEFFKIDGATFVEASPEGMIKFYKTLEKVEIGKGSGDERVAQSALEALGVFKPFNKIKEPQSNHLIFLTDPEGRGVDPVGYREVNTDVSEKEAEKIARKNRKAEKIARKKTKKAGVNLHVIDFKNVPGVRDSDTYASLLNKIVSRPGGVEHLISRTRDPKKPIAERSKIFSLLNNLYSSKQLGAKQQAEFEKLLADGEVITSLIQDRNALQLSMDMAQTLMKFNKKIGLVALRRVIREDKNYKTRLKAMTELAKHSKDPDAEMIKLLDAGPKTIPERKMAIDLLAKSGSKKAVARLSKLVGDPKFKSDFHVIAQNALIDLGKVSESYVEKLIETAEDSGKPVTKRVRAINTLGILLKANISADMAEEIRGALYDDNWFTGMFDEGLIEDDNRSIREVTLKAIYEGKNMPLDFSVEAAKIFIGKELETENYHGLEGKEPIGVAVIEQLGKIGGEDAVSYLKDIAEDDDISGNYREAAALALRNMGTLEAHDARMELQEEISDEIEDISDREVKWAAKKVLQALERKR